MPLNELKSLLIDGDPGTPESRIVRVMSERGTLSAAQIATATGLARSTVSTALAGLRRSGVVIEAAGGDTGKGVGRPATALALNPEAGTCVGIHLGLDGFRLVVADVSHSVIFEKTEELGRDYTPARAATAVKRAIDAAYAENSLRRSGLIGVGISVSGPVSPDGVVQRASIVPLWAGTDIRQTFGPVLQRPIFADNESNCAAIAEMMWGAATGCEDFVLFKIDVGVGGAIVHRGQVMTGVAGSAGEFGHMTIDPDGELCRCGNRGCLELYASFVRPLALAERLHGRRMTMDEVIALALEGDVGSRRLIEDTGAIAGRGLGMIGAIINPPLIVIGGRMALAGDLILEPLIAAYDKHTLIKRRDVDEAKRTRITIGRFTQNDALLGAVGLVLRHHGRLG
ncbi:ROK family transcriptional regulator [Labrys wisconsinensis]|uniref:NBD/HSP70 family sugar kinase n=1 Tax=Labrys wisconsinensis TaxID=425677 RepID=A0ABU0J991_9HYPH|nr:ROK family transcriptional regulator [Labrys wisconsinensis]MDQ0470840.1 putative NBD/HSP70 family sugar kinase [Labrys wisconsinensis]